MRIAVRRGAAQYVIAPSHEAPGAGSRMTFNDRHAALGFLRRFAADPLAMVTLRRDAAAARTSVDAFALTQHQVLDRLAALLVNGVLRVQHVPVAAHGYLEVTEEPVKTHDVDAQGRKWPPDPIVPPEYPLMAWLESNEVKTQRDYINDMLDELMYVGFGISRPPSRVAPTYIEVTGIETAEVRNSAIEMGIKVAYQMYQPRDLTVPPSQIAKEYIAMVKMQGPEIISSVASLATQLDVLRYTQVALPTIAGTAPRDYPAASTGTAGAAGSADGSSNTNAPASAAA